MRVQIVDNAGFAVFAELEPSTSPAGHHSLRLLTKWAGAKDPNSEQLKASVLLKPDGLAALRALLASVSTDTPTLLAGGDQLRLLHVAYVSQTGPLVDAYERARDELRRQLGDGPEYREARNALWETHTRQYAALRSEYEQAQRALREQRT